MNTVGEEALRRLVLSVLEEANSFPTDVYPADFHGLSNRSDERGADGELLLQFYAALAVLTRDMHLYLQEHRQPNAAIFEDLVEEVRMVDRQRWHESAFPLYQGIPGADLSLGLAEAAAAGQPYLSPLGNPTLIHEWSTRPGSLIYKRTLSELNRRGLRKRVCGEDGFLQQYVKKQILAPDLQGMIANSVIVLLMGAETFWVPWAVLISVILVRRGLKYYCDGSPATPAAEGSGRSAEDPTS